MRDLGDFLAQGGAIVGGGAALGAPIGLIVGTVIHDFRPQTDPDQYARRFGALGGVARLVALLDRSVDFVP